MRVLFFCLLSSFFCFTAFSGPSDFPAKPNPPRLINDLAGMLSPAEAAELERKVDTFNDSTSIEISVVIITNLGDYDISDYAAQLGQLWGIGKKGKDNGVLILISKENRKAFIATGYGMEGVLPDSRTQRIIQADLIPQFKRGDYFNGINFTIDAIIRYSGKEYTADPVQNKSGIKPAYVFLFILIAIAVIGFINRKNNGGGNDQYSNRRSGGGFGMFPPLGGFGGGEVEAVAVLVDSAAAALAAAARAEIGSLKRILICFLSVISF